MIEIKIKNEKCVICNKKLMGRPKKFCSKDCMRKSWLQKHPKIINNRNCVFCGKKLIELQRKFCCIECRDEKWRQENKEYGKKRRQENKEYGKKWRQENKEYQRKYRKNKKKIKEYYQKNKEKVKKYRQKYRQENPEYGKKRRQENKKYYSKMAKRFHDWKLSLGCRLCPVREDFGLEQYNWVFSSGIHIELHHVGHKKFTISTTKYHSAVRKNKKSIEEIIKTIPICVFCHRDVTSWGKNDERHERLKQFLIKREEIK